MGALSFEEFLQALQILQGPQKGRRALAFRFFDMDRQQALTRQQLSSGLAIVNRLVLGLTASAEQGARASARRMFDQVHKYGRRRPGPKSGLGQGLGHGPGPEPHANGRYGRLLGSDDFFRVIYLHPPTCALFALEATPPDPGELALQPGSPAPGSQFRRSDADAHQDEAWSEVGGTVVGSLSSAIQGLFSWGSGLDTADDE